MYEFGRHTPPARGAREGEAGVVRLRLEADLDAGELAGAAYQLLMRVVVFDGARDGFAEGDLRRAHVEVKLEGAL